MSGARVCGGTCHKARGSVCRCWCGGVVHGGAGNDAREAFAKEFRCAELPTMERTFETLTGQPDLFVDAGTGERWRTAIAAAVKARADQRATRAAARASGTKPSEPKATRAHVFAGTARRSTRKGEDADA